MLSCLAIQPPVDYQFPLSTRWQYHKQKWDAAQTAGQSAANHQRRLASGTRTTRAGAHAGSRKTAPGSAPTQDRNVNTSAYNNYPANNAELLYACGKFSL